jgi:predicted nuclease of predicted toxin-antitoxin system
MAWGFKLDENLSRDAGSLLSELGHDVETVLEERLGGESDSKVFGVSQAENRILITLDLDFADIRLYPPSDHQGIWVLRPRSQSVDNVLSLVNGAVAVLKSETAAQRLWIVEPGRIRIHE